MKRLQKLKESVAELYLDISLAVLRRVEARYLAVVAAGVAMGVAGDAGASNLPWETPICMVASSLSGPVAHMIAVVVLVITGLLLAFGETGGIFKTGVGVLFGLSFSLLAVRMIQTVFSGTNFGSCGTLQ